MGGVYHRFLKGVPTMTGAEQAQAAKRDEILKLLTDVETAKVSTAESGQNLKPDELYVDLDQLEKGVQQGTAGGLVRDVIPKSAVGVDTWSKIVDLLR
jgi:hypothetical protein